MRLSQHFWEGVQSHTEDGSESLHIIQQASCGITNTILFSYMMNSIDEIGNGLEIILTKWYSEVPDANPRYVSAQDFPINSNINTYPRINQLCTFCWSDISNDHGHLDMMHPACFCGPDRHHTPKDLEQHFKTYTVRNTNCPQKGCEVSFDTLYDRSTHHTAHSNAEPRDKIICTYENRLNLPDCTATILNPFKTIRHALIYHIKTLRSYNNFLLIF